MSGKYSIDAGYGQAQVGAAPYTTGKIFVVAASGDTNFNNIDGLYDYDSEGVQRRHSDISSALSQCVDGRGDVVLLSPNFSTAPTDSELETAFTKNVVMTQGGSQIGGVYYAFRESNTLPQTGDESLFTVTGAVRLLDIIGEVTTDIQNQANNTKLVAKPGASGASNVDICAVLDIANDTAPTIYSITGTLSDALQSNANGVDQAQPNAVIVPEGTIDLSCAASNTGEIRWMTRYVPLEPGARLVAA